MVKLTTKYLGLELKSPVIAGSSNHTSTLAKIKEAEDFGAGAVVLKSLFEEQIEFMISSSGGNYSYPEADDYMAFYIRSNAVDEYLNLIRKAKESVDIPVIPSINCVSTGTWIDFAERIEEAGADALEINMFFLPVKSGIEAAEAEKIYIVLTEKLKERIKIPLAIKLGFRFTNIFNLLWEFYKRKVEGAVMFNRFFEPDIDIDGLSVVPAPVFSTTEEMRYVLRWIAMASALTPGVDISASTGVHTGTDAIKYILAGATTVQVCSVLYKKGLKQIDIMNREIEKWMTIKGFESISSFRGKLNYSKIEKPMIWERAQFMKYFSSYE